MGAMMMAPREGASCLSTQVPAVTRAVAILQLLARSGEPLGVNAVARALNVQPSTCLHILRALAAETLVAVDPATKRYALGLGLVTLARRALATNDFPERAQPMIERLATAYGVTAVALELDGREHMVFVAMARASAAFSIHVSVGSRLPALLSATGRCVAAFSGLSVGELERRFRRLRWESPPSFEQWLKQVETARREGIGIDKGQYARGITVVSAPVFDLSGRVRRALSVVGLSGRLRGATLERLKRDLRQAAGELSERSTPSPRPAGAGGPPRASCRPLLGLAGSKGPSASAGPERASLA
jgi:DNA-binding IclR family transcriptional regulator